MTPEPVTREPPPLRGPVISTQDWRDLTFLHWAVDPARVEGLMPDGVRPDVHEGRTYVGLVPFRMVGVSLGSSPGIPYFGTFLETNVRLYSVDGTGRRGVVFLSLDTDRAVVVPAIRAAIGAPYRWARMRFGRERGVVTYQAWLRRLGERPQCRVVVRVGGVREPTPLDDFLTARWGAHVARRRGTTYVPNTHEPWTLRDAEVLELDDGLLASVGLPGLADRPPDQVAFSDGVHAEFGRPVRVTG
ncbi:YqjF family protein [Nocardioides dilutus]